MALSLSKIKALNELAGVLYPYLPGKAHPFADQDISFEGIAKSLALAGYWSGGSKLPAISQLLIRTLEFQDDKFCPLLLEVVRRSISYRESKGTPISRDEIENLNRIIAEVGFKIPELNEKKFLDSLPKSPRKEPAAGRRLPTAEEYAKFKNDLVKLSAIPYQRRGLDFEDFLNRLFKLFGLAPRESFIITGEQIDGSFNFQGETYLVEATWRNEKVGQEELLIFSGKVSGKAKWSRGVHIAISGYTAEGLEAFSRGKATNMVCVDGYDLFFVLENQIDFAEVLATKVRRAAETNQSHVSAKELNLNYPSR